MNKFSEEIPAKMSFYQRFEESQLVTYPSAQLVGRLAKVVNIPQ